MSLDDLCESLHRMSTLINLIVYACAALTVSVSGEYTECLCNLKHQLCVDSRCATDTSCQRITVVSSNGMIETNDMFCGRNKTENPLCNSANKIDDRIVVRFCCTEPYCNANNTYLSEFIRARLGDDVSNLLNTVTTPATNTTMPTTSTGVSVSSKTENNQNSSDSPKVWIIIALLTILFFMIQIICVTVTLIVGCRKLKSFGQVNL